MKIILFITYFFTVSAFIAQVKDTAIDESKPKIENNNRIIKPYSGNYTFVSKVFEDGKNDTIFTREVNVFISDITEKTLTYSLYCVKYKFEDPEFQPFLKKIAYLFDELYLTVDQNGKIISIDEKNIAQIKKRWEETRKKILQNNSGQVLLNYLETIDKSLNNKDLLYDFFQNDKMYGMLFNGIANYEIQTIKSKNKKPLETIKIPSKQNISNEKYKFQNGILVEATKTEKQSGEENTKLQYEVQYNGKEKW